MHLLTLPWAQAPKLVSDNDVPLGNYVSRDNYAGDPQGKEVNARLPKVRHRGRTEVFEEPPSAHGLVIVSLKYRTSADRVRTSVLTIPKWSYCVTVQTGRQLATMRETGTKKKRTKQPRPPPPKR